MIHISNEVALEPWLYPFPLFGVEELITHSFTVRGLAIIGLASIRGSRNSDGVLGTATEVYYEPELEGTATGGAAAEVVIDSFLNSIDDDNIVNSTNSPRDLVEVRMDTSTGEGTFGSP